MIISTEKLYINDPINIFIGCNFDYINNIDGTKILFGNILNNNIENIKNINCYYILGAKDLKYNKDVSFKTYNILQIYRDSRLLSFICGGISKELRIDDEKQDNILSIASKSEETFVTYHIHLIKENETIESIMSQYQVSKDTLENYNDLSKFNLGEKLIIPCNE